MQIVAITDVFYANRTHHPGDVFDADDEHARMLIGWGKVKPPDNRAMVPKQETPKKKDPPPPARRIPNPRRKRYLRRDMVAED